MRFSLSQLAVLAFVTATTAQTQYTATGAAAVAKARATALTESPTSYVKGKTFDRFVTIFLENTDYDSAAADRETPPVPLRAIRTNSISKPFIPCEPGHQPHELFGSIASVTTELCGFGWWRYSRHLG